MTFAVFFSLPWTTSVAATREDQVRQLMFEKSIPNWRQAAVQIAEIRTRLSQTPFQETWGTLDGIVKSASGGAAASRASNPRDSNELIANSSWLRWKILADKADGRYLYTYSYLLGLMKGSDGDLMREATVFFITGV